MQVQSILLTGDDGYNSIGIRTLIHHLKKKYRLSIAATKWQQSGVGGKISLNHPVHWEEIEVDGVRGVYVDGTPSDAVECALGYYKSKFDLVISGINFGVNIGGSFVSSGTIAAALRALLVRLTNKALALSLNLQKKSHILRAHNGVDNINKYLLYPGKAAYELIEETIKNNFWSSSFININFPAKEATKAIFTKPLSSITDFYNYPLKFNYKNKTFSYPFGIKPGKAAIEYDGNAVLNGYISVTPCKPDFLHNEAYEKVKNQVIRMP